METQVKIVEEPMVMGAYVHGVGYRLMRLRMLVCGTAGPSEEEWADGLGRLLSHLDKFPLPK